MKLSFLLTTLTAGLTLSAAAEPFDLDLFGGKPPGPPVSAEADVLVKKEGDPIVRLTHVQKPTIRVYLPPKEKATGAAVVICPGGGYRILAIEHEGNQVAEWLNSIGVAGVVCKYRVSDKVGATYQHPVPLLDAREALRATRQHAAEWGLDPQRIGVMGFSAGGHLAAAVATMFEDPLPGDDPNTLLKMEHKPDFAVLIYPVITMSKAFGHRGSADTLLGKDAAEELREKMSTETRVTAKTPPTFLVGTFDDKAVPPLNAMAFYRAMFEQKIPGELHIWEKGGHGYGLLPSAGDVAVEWPPRLAKWMAGRGLLTKK